MKKKNSAVSMPFLEHLRELRNRLIFSLISIFIFSVVAYIFYNKIIYILSKPFENITKHLYNKILFINSIYEGFLIRVKVSLFSGIILSIPVILYNIIKFVFPGLKFKEKKVIIMSLIASFVLLILGVYYGYYKILPLSVRFLTGNSFIPANVGVLLNFGRNIFYIFQFILGSLLIFQLPLILVLLMHLNILKRKTVLKLTRYIIVGIFILSAIITPPDVVSQIFFALPLTILLFIAILIAKIFKFGEG